MKIRAFNPIVLLSFCFPVVCGATTLSSLNSTRTRGRKAFEELASLKIFTQGPTDYITTRQKHLVVAHMAHKMTGHYIPNDVVELTVSYIAPDHRYSTQELERIKKEAKTVKKNFLSAALIGRNLIPFKLQAKIQGNWRCKIETVHGTVHGKLYPVNNVLDHLLFGKEKESLLQICRSLLCGCFCHCCKGSLKVNLHKYEEAIERGWEDESILRIKELVDRHVQRIERGHFHQDIPRRAVGFYMGPVYHIEKQV